MRRSVLLLLIICAFAWEENALGHNAPMLLPPPLSQGEAWNVIEQAGDNVDQLLAANLMRDVGGQLANISLALRYLNSVAAGVKQDQIRNLTSKLASDEAGLLVASRDSDNAETKTRTLWTEWRENLRQLATLYPTDVVQSEIYICPMHPQDRHLNANEMCSVCGMSLVRRHLPASAVYQKPGEPTLKLTANCAPLVVGRPAQVAIHLAREDGSPVSLEDLIEMHTRKIHLLINDQSLSDYHHEHPTPGQKPGDYVFTFTPERPGPYRIWADVIPAASGIQEYDIADLPAGTAPLPISDRLTQMSRTVGGRRFDLTIDTRGGPIQAGKTYLGTIVVTGTDGKPFDELQPLMGAYAHLVGFSEDGKSVLHIHPSGKEPAGAEDLGGPAFAFKFYAPAAGFLRFYCQVRIGGADQFVPFNLTITK